MARNHSCLTRAYFTHNKGGKRKCKQESDSKVVRERKTTVRTSKANWKDAMQIEVKQKGCWGWKWVEGTDGEEQCRWGTFSQHPQKTNKKKTGRLWRPQVCTNFVSASEKHLRKPWRRQRALTQPVATISIQAKSLSDANGNNWRGGAALLCLVDLGIYE